LASTDKIVTSKLMKIFQHAHDDTLGTVKSVFSYKIKNASLKRTKNQVYKMSARQNLTDNLVQACAYVVTTWPNN
jgi:hypothetical protein